VFCEGEAALCQSEEGEPRDGRDQTLVFCEGETVLYRIEHGEPRDGRDQTCFVKEKQRCIGVRKGSQGMVEIKRVL